MEETIWETKTQVDYSKMTLRKTIFWEYELDSKHSNESLGSIKQGIYRPAELIMEDPVCIMEF
jgi:hypothetical protein